MTCKVNVSVTSDDLVTIRFSLPESEGVVNAIDKYCTTLGINDHNKSIVFSSQLFTSFGTSLNTSHQSPPPTVKQLFDMQSRYFKLNYLDIRINLRVSEFIFSRDVANVMYCISEWMFQKLPGVEESLKWLLRAIQMCLCPLCQSGSHCAVCSSFLHFVRNDARVFQGTFGRLPWGTSVLSTLGYHSTPEGQLLLTKESISLHVAQAIQTYVTENLLTNVVTPQDEKEDRRQIEADERLARALAISLSEDEVLSPRSPVYLIRSSSLNSATINEQTSMSLHIERSSNSVSTRSFQVPTRSRTGSQGSLPTVALSSFSRRHSQPHVTSHVTRSVFNIDSRDHSLIKHKESCVICLGEYEVGDKVQNLHCLHKFHQKCISRWIREKHECPTCRTAT